MLRSGSARLFLEWQAYSAIEPFGEWRADLRIAQLDALFANANRGKGTPPRKITDFLFDFEKPPEKPQTKVERLKAAGYLIAKAVGGIWQTGKK